MSKASIITVRMGNPLELHNKEKEESKGKYDNRCLIYIMKSIENQLSKSIEEFINNYELGGRFSETKD